MERKARKYLRERQVSTLQIVRHKIGYAASGAYGWRIIFPVLMENGKVCGYTGRDFTTHQKPKYLNSTGYKGLWNAQRRARTAVVVEGIMDALRVEKALLRARDAVAVARLGSIITPLQMDQLKQFEQVIIFPDQDKPGVEGAVKLGAAVYPSRDRDGRSRA